MAFNVPQFNPLLMQLPTAQQKLSQTVAYDPANPMPNPLMQQQSANPLAQAQQINDIKKMFMGNDEKQQTPMGSYVEPMTMNGKQGSIAWNQPPIEQPDWMQRNLGFNFGKLFG